MNRITTILSLLGLFATSVSAEPLAITNASIETMAAAGSLESATVIIDQGRILAVGTEVIIPADARIIDAAGRTVTPGLVSVGSGLGLVEVRMVDVTDDAASANPDVGASLDVRWGINPDSVLIPAARLGGLTRAIVTPDYGSLEHPALFAGQAAAIHLGEGMDLLVAAQISLVLQLGEDGATRAGGARGAAMVTLHSQLEQARAYSGESPALGGGWNDRESLSQADLRAISKALDRNLPLLVEVHRASDILQVIEFAQTENLKVILTAAEEAWRVRAQIAAAGIPVIIRPTQNHPSTFDSIGATLQNARLLHEAGVMIAFMGNDVHRARESRYNAGNAVAEGLPWRAALEAITINPARMFGLESKFGSIEAGKEADLVLWSGDPLEILSIPELVVIRGQVQPLQSRGTLLRDRYMPADDSKPAAFRHGEIQSTADRSSKTFKQGK